MAKKEVALRKRQKIHKANHNIFIVVAVAAFIAGFSLVGATFLIKKIIFNQKVLSEKNNTISTLRQNNKNVPKLEEDIKVLKTNEALLSSKFKSDQDPLTVVLDSLPAQVNSTALGSSLKEKLLSVQGTEIETLMVQNTDSEALIEESITATAENKISFAFKVSSPRVNDLNLVLRNLERSIRVMHVDSLIIEQGEEKNWLTVEGHTYYEPMLQASLKTKTVKAGE